MDSPAFRTYAEQALAPQLRPGDVVIWDNLTPHRDAQVERAPEQAGAAVVPLPPYRSGPTAIAGLGSQAKGSLRPAAARAAATLHEAMGAALRTVCPGDLPGWSRSRGWRGGPGLKAPGPMHSTDCGSHPCCSWCAIPE
jgi:hypothetical protein